MSNSTPPEVASTDAGTEAAGSAGLPSTELARCLNCGAVLSGLYCSSCGQKHEPHIHSIGHFISEATESITHADSRLWRTLAALVRRPGFLTQEFFAGRRSSYMPPVRLYLVLSVVFFLLASTLSHDTEIVRIDDSDISGAAAKPGTAIKPASPAATDTADRYSEKTGKFCTKATYSGPWQAELEPRLRAGCSKVFADKGRTLAQTLLHNLPRALFVLLPLIALFMRLMYWVPKRFYVEHLLLLLHNHAFVFLAFGVELLISQLPWEWPFGILAFVLTFYMPWYFYKSLRVYYGQGRVLTLTKFVVLSFIYLMVALLTLLVTAIISVATL